MGDTHDDGRRRDAVDAAEAHLGRPPPEAEGTSIETDAPCIDQRNDDRRSPRPASTTRLLVAIGWTILLAGFALAWFPRALGLGVTEDSLERLDSLAMNAEQGHAFTIPVAFDVESDSGGVSPLILLEDGRPLGRPHAVHQDIREHGAGRYSHWGSSLYFSTSDGSDPRVNGRVYAIRIPGVLTHEMTHRWPWRLPLSAVVALIGFLIVARSRPTPTTPRPNVPRAPSRRRLADIATGSCLVLGLCAYVAAASVQSEVVNTDRVKGDQSAYLYYTEGLVTRGDEFVAERNRMPALPVLMRLAYSPGLDQEAFFQRAKALQIAISLVLLGIVFAVFRVVMDRSLALLLTGVSAFLLFAFKAGWVQAELLSYTLSLLTVALMVFALARSSPWLALAAGTSAALGHLAKASAPPSVALFVLVGCVVAARAWFKRSGSMAARIRHTLVPVSLVFAFLIVLWPYISESKREYGSYFYNVNSTFYMWYDSWDECLQGTGAHSDLYHWPDMPEDEIPGPLKWFDEHGLTGALDRLSSGWTSLTMTLARDSYGYLDYAFALPFLALVLSVGRPRRTWDGLLTRWPAIAFVLFYLAGYALLYVWYAKVIAQQRFILSLLLPLLWATGLVVAHCESWYPTISLRGRRVSVTTVFVLLLAGLLVADVHAVLTDRVWTVNGGN